MSNRFKGQYHGYMKARENLPEKNPSGEKIWQKIWIGTMAQTQRS